MLAYSVQRRAYRCGEQVWENKRRLQATRFELQKTVSSIEYIVSSKERKREEIQEKEKGTGNFLNQKSSQSPFILHLTGRKQLIDRVALK